MKKLMICLVAVMALLFCVSSCKPSLPSGVLSKGKMTDILYDYHLALAMAHMDDNGDKGQSLAYREAVLRKQEAGLKRRMLQFKLDDPQPLLFHNEAVVRDSKIVSIVTSGNYGHFLGGAIGMGYVPCEGQSEADVLGSNYEIEIAGVRVKAEASLAPMYDPKAERVRA